MKIPKPKWKPGDTVMLVQAKMDSHGGLKMPIEDRKTGREYGRVVAVMWNKKMEWYDCWVAFFGFKWPTDRMLDKQKPYMLRYLETSLRAYTPKKGENGWQGQTRKSGA
jgi:hypothetical protein